MKYAIPIAGMIFAIAASFSSRVLAVNRSGTPLAVNSNNYGASTTWGQAATMQTTTEFLPTVGSALEVDVDGTSIAVSGAGDSVSLERYQAGWKLVRRKVGYQGAQVGIYDSQGNLVSSSDTLNAPVSQAFAAAAGALQNFSAVEVGPNPPYAGSGANHPGGGTYNPALATPSNGYIGAKSGAHTMMHIGCRTALVVGGLGIVGQFLGAVGAWFTGPVLGVPATIAAGAGIVATNDWVMGKCNVVLKRK